MVLLRRLLLALLAASPAAALNQPGGAVIPTPLGCKNNQPFGLGATFACVCNQPNVCNIGAPCPNMGQCDDGKRGICESTIWHTFNDNTCIPSNLAGLDPQKDAAVTPETFRPTCPLTFTILSRGDALFQDAFGWYNVTGKRPDPADLHVMLDCKAQAGKQVVLDVRNEPGYKGGEIGFFLITPESLNERTKCQGGDCCAALGRANLGNGQIFYSQRAYNPDNMGPNSYIHLIIYNSKTTPRKFYFAWEDLLSGGNNDFLDLLTSVQGVECTGAGQGCSTGKMGICALGVTQCESGQIRCRQLYQPGMERCDGLDNDCDGKVDVGATCPAGEVCWTGECISRCALEFPCPTGYSCEQKTGLCVDPLCAGVPCPADKICQKGQCGAPCDGIVCPKGQSCRLGNCIDPCKGVACAMGLVCSEGFCVPGCGQCDGLTCDKGKSCDPKTGNCIDPSCPGGCPGGQFCVMGMCKDACEGAVCPRGQTCKNGDCVFPAVSPDMAMAGPVVDLAMPPGPTPPDLVDPFYRPDFSIRTRDNPGCSCAVGARAPGPSGLWAALAIVVALGWRRRR